MYYNCGDWVESCTALVEHDDGRFELIDGLALIRRMDEARIEPEPVLPLEFATA